jgi:hypothetical protein
MQQLQELQVPSSARSELLSTHSFQADEKRLDAQQKEMAAELARMREALVRNNEKLEEVPAVFVQSCCRLTRRLGPKLRGCPDSSRVG